jgi:hypothetical protein
MDTGGLADDRDLFSRLTMFKNVRAAQKNAILERVENI